ncbi:hypothetical protein SUDANB96_03444 [Streptomyces sp. enrichment culture]
MSPRLEPGARFSPGAGPFTCVLNEYVTVPL